MKYELSILLLLLSIITNGQNEVILKPLAPKPFIEVIGTASQEVVPDKIFLSITLTNKIIDKQQYNIELQEEKLKKVLVKNNIDLELLSLSDANSGILTQKKKDIGFRVNKIFTLQLSTADQVSRVSKELQDLNIKETAIIKLEHSKIDSLRKVVRIAAIMAAKDKALYLLQAIAEQLDKPLEIKEIVEEPDYRNNLTNNTILLSKTNVTNTEDNNGQIGFEKIKIRFSYFIKYGIK